MSGRAIGFAAALVLIGVMVFFLKMTLQGASSEEAKAQLIEELSTLDDYAENKAVYDHLVDAAHAEAYASAYQSGSTSTPEAKARRYRESALLKMISTAMKEEREDIAQKLDALRAKGT